VAFGLFAFDVHQALGLQEQQLELGQHDVVRVQHAAVSGRAVERLARLQGDRVEVRGQRRDQVVEVMLRQGHRMIVVVHDFRHRGQVGRRDRRTRVGRRLGAGGMIRVEREPGGYGSAHRRGKNMSFSKSHDVTSRE
jgi:hypothetical protein